MKMPIFQAVQSLVQYGINESLLKREDQIYARNRMLAVLGLNDWQEWDPSEPLPELITILSSILDWAYEQGVLQSNTITERDILDTELMNCLMPRPSEVIHDFYSYKNPKDATDYFYHLSRASNYIRSDRIAKNKLWKAATPYGEIDITINLSKPEKDPKEIAMLKNAPSASYPTCLLCKENEGYKGNLRNPARATHRVIPLSLNGEDWYLQYSPYVYYQEHSIIFKKEHVPMKISRQTFDRLLDFTEKFPHYFIGSNADLPIVGGSILTHDHFQSGRYEFAIERAAMGELKELQGFPSVKIAIVNWPMSVIRVQGDKEEVGAATETIWKTWQEYSDPAADIYAYSGETPHNTVTPIARRRGDLYEMDVVLRNNRITAEFPDGIFHPHQELHHIKKENIGLIEVMGLAVLPGRLAEELKLVAEYLLKPRAKDQWDSSILKHWDWVQQLLQKGLVITEDNVIEMLQAEVGNVFKTVLEHAGVFKKTAAGQSAFEKFIKHLQLKNLDNK